MKKPAFHDRKFGNKVVRRDYSKIASNFVEPDLLEIQKKSFDKFLKTELEALIKNIFPIQSPQGKYRLDFQELEFDKIKYSEEECRFESKSYDVPVYVRLKLTNNEENGVQTTTKKTKRSKDSERIFFGNIPLMSDKGTFVINGIEKFVIAQIVRSPGFYVLNKSQIKLNNSRKRVLEGCISELLPHKGTLMLMNIPAGKQFIQVTARSSIGESAPKFMVTVLMKAYGLSEENIYQIYGRDNEIINDTLANEIYNARDIFNNEEIKAILKDIEEEQNRGLNPEEFLRKGSPVERKLRRLLYKYSELKIELENSELDAKSQKKMLAERDVLVNAIITEKAARDLVLELNISPKIIESHVTEENSCYQAVILMHLFVDRYYDLSSAGRYKFNHKLKVSERLYQTILAEDLKDQNGNVVISRGTLCTKDVIKKYQTLMLDNSLATTHTIKVATPFKDFQGITQPDTQFAYEKVLVYTDNNQMTEVTDIIGSIPSVEETSLTIMDIVAITSYVYNLTNEIGSFDDIDHLGNKRLKLIHELLRNRLNVAMVRIEKGIREKLAIADGGQTTNSTYVEHLEEGEVDEKKNINVKSILNTKPFQIILKDFFNSYQLIQFIDQQNPLSELTNKRRISAMGPGGISREDPNLDIRNVHYSHYGKICPIETPEGMNIGLIMSLASYSQVDEHGFIITPYRVVKDGVVTDEIKWLTPLQDDEYVIAETTADLDEHNHFLHDSVIARYRGSFNVFKPENVDFIDILPKQIISVAASSIPFLDNDDANRALMGANMQRQAVPLIRPHAPWVATGSEYKIAHDSGMAQTAKEAGEVVKVDGRKVVVQDETGNNHEYSLVKYRKSNQDTCNTQEPIVELGQKVEVGTTLANGPAMQNGELALGNNVLVAFTTWRGYNFEDAVILSERLVKEDLYTSIHIEEHVVQCLTTKNGDETITREIPNVPEYAKRYLDANGIVMVGAEVKEGDVLVGKTTPRGHVELQPEEKLLQAIFGKKTESSKESSLKVPHGGEGIVAAVKILNSRDHNNLGDDVLQVVKVYIAQKRKIQVGDKMAGRHGNKGVISKVVPVEDMPFLDDGTPIDIMLNPLGVPSRMNIGQILEIHLGLAARELGKKELLKIVYENQGVQALVDRFGLRECIAENLYKEIDGLIQTVKPKSYASLIQQVKTIDLVVALNHQGLTFDDLGYKVATPSFQGVNADDLKAIMAESGIDPEKTNGKFHLRDGRTGEYFDGQISVGVMYMLKLDHMVDDKIHARSVGPYSKITQQPLGGKSQNGGQRFGEMEVWALEAYGAAHNLYEILTIKSDDVRGRNLTYNAIVKGQPIPNGGIPESFKLLTKQLQGLGIYLEVIDDKGKATDINNFIGHEYDDITQNEPQEAVVIEDDDDDDDRSGIIDDENDGVLTDLSGDDDLEDEGDNF